MALSLLFCMVANVFLPARAWALTSGPTQPEVHGFEPIGTSDMVNPFTGDFTYNIPLFELPGPEGGYPFNLAYHGVSSMDQEASWVGLGWDLNPGSITRNVRGVPDDFKGDPIRYKSKNKPNVNVGVGLGADVELFGIEGVSAGLNVYHDNYSGLGYGGNLGLPLKGLSASISEVGKYDLGLQLSVGVSYDSQGGIGVSPSVSSSHLSREIVRRM